MVRQLAGRAGARLLAALAVVMSRHTALRALLRLPLPERRVPRVLGVDDFALCRRRRYATVLIDAVTRQRVDVLPDRKAATLEEWLREHPGVEVVCRDSCGAYAEAVRRALPQALQVADRWHLWHNLAEAVGKEVTTHSSCWATAGPPQEGIRAVTTRQRWQQVHDLLDKGVGLLECARRLHLGLNTITRYARISQPQRLVRAPQYRLPSSTPTATTYADAGNRTLLSALRNSSPRSGNWATPAASTCSTAPSPKAESKPTAPPCHPDASPATS